MSDVLVSTDGINPLNRYGHPSLAVCDEGEHKGYDGKVYYAGWIAQRSTCLEVFMYTGRCPNLQLSRFQKHCLELYVAIEFMKAYGEQDFRFVDRVYGAGGLFFFLRNRPFDREHLATARTYSAALLKEIAQLDQQGELSEEKLKVMLGLEDIPPESVSEKKGRINSITSFEI